MKKHLAAMAATAIAMSMMTGVSHADDNPSGCASDVAGGEWRSYGGTNDNKRTQAEETSLDAARVQALTVDWAVNPSAIGMTGAFSNTPVVADGCVYGATDGGWVFSVNADTGALNWAKRMTGAGQALLGGVIVGSVAVEYGVVYVGVSEPSKPYVAAFDQATGALLWRTRVETGQNNALINASPKIADGMVFMGFAGNEGGSVARGGYAILDAGRDCGGNAFITEGPQAGTQILFCENPVVDATGGTRLVHEYTISDAEYAAGYRGASVWCTAALHDGFVYACGGNPASKKIEHPNSNALLKIDMRRSSPRFGELVDSYKGDTDQYYPGLDRQPVCDAFGDQLVVVWSLACLQLDLDFGSSPIVYEDALGRLVVGDLQKSGVWHTIYADQMNRKWTTIMGLPCAACNAASPAYAVVDGEPRVFAAATPGSIMESLAAENGRYRWAFPIGGGTHFQSTSTANGLVYTTANDGMLHVFDAATGVPVTVRSISQDVGGGVTAQAGSTGVAIARGEIFVAQASWLVAYQ
jgi:outer membrane protein assembly factor BamB